jgi:pyruvate/2-oxoglutarate dehydrogenase complex dihydrolipoamide acyltransferase (E2) component
MAVTKVVMPKLSDAMESGKIIKWLKKEGDRIQGGDILAEVETDKADVEMEAFGAGVLRKILVPAGDTAPIGTLIGVIAEPGEDITALVASAAGGGRCAGRRRRWRRSVAGSCWGWFGPGGRCRGRWHSAGGRRCGARGGALFGAGEGFAVG